MSEPTVEFARVRRLAHRNRHGAGAAVLAVLDADCIDDLDEWIVDDAVRWIDRMLIQNGQSEERVRMTAERWSDSSPEVQGQLNELIADRLELHAIVDRLEC